MFAAIGADLTGLVRGLKQADDQVHESARVFESYGDVIDVIERKGTRLGMALSAAGAGAIALATDFAMTAGRSQELAVVMEVVGGNAGFATDELHAAADAVKDQGITSQVAYKTITELAWAEIDLARATDLAASSQDAAVISGQDSSEALAGIIHGIRTLNPLVLRTYGYTVDLQVAYENEARTLGISVDALSKKQKQAAATNMVLEQAVAIEGAYEGAMGTATKQIRSMNRYVIELREAYGQHLLPVLGLVVTSVKTVINFFTDLPAPLQAVISYGTLVGGVFAAITGGLLLLIPQVAKTIDGFIAITTVVKAIIQPTQAATVATEGLAAAQVTATGTSVGFSAAMVTVASVAGTVAAGVAAILLLFKGLDWWQDKQRKSMEETSESYEDYIAQMEEFLEVQNAMGTGHQGAVEDMERMLGTLIMTREQWEQNREVMKGTTESLEEETKAVRETSVAWEDYYGVLKKGPGGRDYTGREQTPQHYVYGTTGGLAEGGIVTSPSLRWLGEEGPEAVIPLNKLQDMGAQSQVIFNITPGVAADRTALRELAKEVARLMGRPRGSRDSQTAFAGGFA